MCVWDLPQSLVSSALNCITLWLSAGLSPPILLGVQTEDLCLSAWEVLELLLKNDFFPSSLCFLFGVLEFSFGYWSSRTYPPTDITFFGFHSILQDENPPSTISSSSSICFHCSYTFLFPGDFLLLLLSEFLVTSYLCVRNVIFSPNSEHFVDFFKFTMSYISNVYSKHVHMFCLLFAICLFF